MSRNVVILGGMRTPMAEYNGHFSRITGIELGAIASKAALEKTGVKPSEIDHAVFGNAQQSSVDAHYGGRHVALKAGCPDTVPAFTVNRICGSGIQSIVNGAQLIRLDEATTVLAGGYENMTQIPHMARGLRGGVRLGKSPQLEDWLWTGLDDPIAGCTMAGTAENVAEELGISREDADEFALRSQKAAAAAKEAGRLKEEIVPVEVKTRKGPFSFDDDDHARADSTMEGLAKLKPAFKKDGIVTAGNASGIVDAGAAVILMESEKAKGDGRDVLGSIRGWSYAGVEPRLMGLGPVKAINDLLKAHNLSLSDIGLFEINEAFSPQYLGVERELGLDRDKVNVNGGAIALGHPLGATGTRLTLTLLLELKRRGGGLGIASACIGGGQGIAILVEQGG